MGTWLLAPRGLFFAALHEVRRDVEDLQDDVPAVSFWLRGAVRGVSYLKRPSASIGADWVSRVPSAPFLSIRSVGHFGLYTGALAIRSGISWEQ